ncbi:hypothetical protein [Erythrobacter sp. R86502]|uniref:hypothetical protein n=1 Tax=Erythrobacter sp. R86502 TaxID=3093846 RepID=UPI0036D29DCD
MLLDAGDFHFHTVNLNNKVVIKTLVENGRLVCAKTDATFSLKRMNGIKVSIFLKLVSDEFDIYNHVVTSFVGNNAKRHHLFRLSSILWLLISSPEGVVCPGSVNLEQIDEIGNQTP